MSINQSVQSGDNSDNYLSGRDINITNIGKGLDDEQKANKLSEIKRSLIDDCENDFETLAKHVISNSDIIKTQNGYSITNVDNKIDREIAKNIKILEIKTKDIHKIEEMLMGLGIYERIVPYDIREEVHKRVNQQLLKLKNKDDLWGFIIANKLVITLSSIIAFLLFYIFISDTQNNYEFNNESHTDSYLPEHDLRLVSFSNLSQQICLKGADILVNYQGYKITGKNSENVWLLQNDYKAHLHCDSKKNIVAIVVIGPDSRTVLDKIDAIEGIFK